MTTRTSDEIKAATDEVYNLMSRQPKRRGWIPAPPKFSIDILACTSPSCSNRRCSCSRGSQR
ncbi:hypothetical protein AB0L65_33330 [Nonomuraea sp. NPDC052116]|uniref:hypothetical protein n=1 Tax=Nonomuraea sp. NPDC052116 TaxID=3155665 RepID=UPI00342C1505